MSAALTVCVSAPMEMMSTPVSATSRRFFSPMLPLASTRVRPATNADAFAHEVIRHIVEHDDVRTGIKRFGKLFFGFDLDLDF